MSSYILANQSRNVQLVYRCSKCNNPVSISTAIFAAVQVASSMLNSTTTDEAAAYVMDQLEEDINRSSEEKTHLRKEAVTSEELINRLKIINISPSSYLKCKINNNARGGAWFVMENSTFCPICGHREAWQQEKASVEDLEGLAADNFPKVYHSKELAELFVKLILQEKNDRIVSTRLSPDAVNMAQNEYREKMCRKQEIEEKVLRSSNRTTSELDAVTREMDALNDQLRQLKAFDIKAKKSIDQQIKEKKKEIDEMVESLKQEEQNLQLELHQLDLDMGELSYLIFGSSGTAQIVLAQNAYGYRLIANTQDTNPIP